MLEFFCRPAFAAAMLSGKLTAQKNAFEKMTSLVPSQAEIKAWSSAC